VDSVPQLNLEQIGRRAGVSRSTVSRVINGAENVSDDARERVLAVIAETGYRPHAAARSLASSRTGLIGLIVPSAVSELFDDPYFGRLIMGIARGANAADVTMVLLVSEPEDEGSSIIPRVVNPGLVDGVIVTATRMNEPLLDHLIDADMPFISVGRPDVDEITSIDADNFGGARAAAEHLVALGRHRLALIAAPSWSTAGIDRRAGFLEGVAAAGLAVEGRVREGDWTQDSGQAAMTELLESRPNGVFVASDRMAAGALRAISAAGLRCPQDVAVVSFDGLIPPNQTTPSLTTVAQPVLEVGDQAVRLLCEVIEDDAVAGRHVVLPTELIVRRSCGATAETGT
jgi:LacI family transcriptional regulator